MASREPCSVVYVRADDAPLYCDLPTAPPSELAVRVVDRPLTVAQMFDGPSPDLVVLEVNDAPDHALVATFDRFRELVPTLSVLYLTRTADAATQAEILWHDGDAAVPVGPGSSSVVRDVAVRMAGEGRDVRARASARTVVLAIGAHPDDVEIGVGGILAAHHDVGDTVAILTMSRGDRGGDAGSRATEAGRAAATVGARLYLEDLPDTEMVPDGDTVRRMEAVVREVAPTVVYVHSVHDRHQDHRAVHHAAVVATRQVPMLACYQSPSSTVEFQPNRFVSIDGYLDAKLRMLAQYTSQAGRDYLDPGYVTTTARYWSRYGAGHECEPLEVVRNNTVVGSLRHHRVMSEVASGVEPPEHHAPGDPRPG